MSVFMSLWQIFLWLQHYLWNYIFCLSLKWCVYTVRDSFFILLYLHKIGIWMCECGSWHIFSHNKSLISSQDLPDVIASVIKVCVKPFDLAWASFVLLSVVRSAAVSMCTSQSSSSVALCPLKTDISCSKEFVRLICFWAEHRVFV